MKILIISVVVALLSVDQKVFCDPIFDFLTQHISNIAVSMTKTFNNIKYHVTKMFSPPPNLEPPGAILRRYDDGNSNIKRTFNDFVEKTAAENETEIPEYINLKAEPTALMSTPQLATLHGRRVESHVIHSKDGYLLTLHRITPKLDSVTLNLTVILHHGLLGSSADWILLGPEKSLPYMLANVGYDVWMANARGNYYSRGHISKTVDSNAFWQFSFQEMGIYDLPTVIDYIRSVKKSDEPIDYIGHSMGATALMVMLSTTPQYNQYIRIGILLAPLVFMTNTEGPLRYLAALASKPPDKLQNLIGTKEFMPSRKVPKWLALKYCKGPLLFCCNPLYFFSGGIPADNYVWNLSFLARLLYHVPAGASANTIRHFAQLIKSGKFHRYNNVSDDFPLNKVMAPIVLFSSSDDWLATTPDLLKLYFSIGNPVDHYIIRGMNLSHSEFVWGAHADQLVFLKVLEFLDNGLSVYRGARSNEIQNDFLLSLAR